MLLFDGFLDQPVTNELAILIRTAPFPQAVTVPGYRQLSVGERRI